jgi:flavin-binding protein dodecin
MRQRDDPRVVQSGTEVSMSIVKVIEVLAQSETSWEDAVKDAVQSTAATVKDIQSVYCQDFQAVVENDQVTKYRVNCKISFLVHR